MIERKISIADFMGKRCLLAEASGYGKKVDEYRILEVSPSGNWVKLQSIYGNKFWKAIAEVSFVEELINLKADKPQDA